MVSDLLTYYCDVLLQTGEVEHIPRGHLLFSHTLLRDTEVGKRLLLCHVRNNINSFIMCCSMFDQLRFLCNVQTNGFDF